jgi:magnesium transporter
MDPSGAADVLVRLPGELASGILDELPSPAAALMLRPLGPSERRRLLGMLPKELARSLQLALYHPEDTAGAMMESAVLALPVDINAGEARKRVRRRSRQAGHYLYVVNEARMPVGVVSLRELMLASPRVPLTSFVRSPVVRITASADAEAIVAHSGWRELHALPVVDEDGILVGVLRRETVEQLRRRTARRQSQTRTGPALALAEMFWTLAATAVDGLAELAGPRPAGSQTRTKHDEG